MTAESIEQLRDELHHLRRHSRQSSCRRRFPDAHVASCGWALLNRVEQLTRSEPTNVAAWRLLCDVAEIMVRPVVAIEALERVMALSGHRDRADLKRLARLQGEASWWEALGITPQQLAKLGEFLATAHRVHPVGEDEFQFTSAWAQSEGLDSRDIIHRLMLAGATSDMQVFNNLVH